MHYVSQPPVENWEDFVGAGFCCPYILGDCKQWNQIRQKTLEFSLVLS